MSRIRVLAFATAADALGDRSLELELPKASRIRDLGRRLCELRPALEPVWPRLAVAVDGRIAGPDEILPDGAEVALLPPVSGGAEPRTRLVEEEIPVGAVERSVADPTRGAVLVFVGRVRDHHRGRTVEELTYDAYRPMAEAALERIAEQIEAASPGLALRIVHRLGRLRPGEASVVIAAASPHRAAAYEANRTALERLKREVPIWKRERYADGETVWREEEPLARPAAEPSRSR